MQLSIIQILILLAIFFFITKAIVKLKKRTIPSQSFILQLIFWGVVGYVVVAPEVTQQIANFVGIGRGVDLVIYISIIFLFSLYFMMLEDLQELKYMLTKLGRAIALKDAQNNTEQKDKKDGPKGS